MLEVKVDLAFVKILEIAFLVDLIVSLKLVISTDGEGLGNPFKQGTPLGIEIDGKNLHLMGLVTVVR